MSGRTGETAIAIAVCAALCLAVAALYARTAGFDWIALDDYSVIVDRPEINRGLTAAGVRAAFTTIQPDWQPLTTMSHMLTFALLGDDAGRHHLVNPALHALNAALLFLALWMLTGAPWPSALAAALFAVHPLRAESVAWVAERKDTLSGLFWMLTLLAYAGYARRPRLGRYAAVLLALALGLMSKSMLVSLPLVLLLLDLWPLARWRGATGAGTAGVRLSLGRLVVEKLPLLVLAAGSAAVTFATATQSGSLKSFEAFSFGWRLAIPPLAYAAYLLESVWPVGLAVMYPHPALIGTPLTSVGWRAGLAAALLLAVTGFCLATRRTRPYLLVGWLWFLITLLPVIGVVQVGYQWYADRFTYIPSIGLAIMLAWSLRDLVAQRPRLRAAVSAAAVGLLIGLAILSWRQIGTWRDSVTLFEHAAAATPNNYFAHQTLGAVLLDEGDFDGARRHLEEALRIRPDEAYAHQQLGMWFENKGDTEQAARSYEEALRLEPYWAQTSLRQLFLIRLAQGRLDEALTLMQGPGAADPSTAELHLVLGEALLQQRRIPEAVAQMERAVALAPTSTKALNNLGVALAHAGRYAEAAKQFERVLVLEPDHREAAKNLNYARQQMGRS